MFLKENLKNIRLSIDKLYLPYYNNNCRKKKTNSYICRCGGIGRRTGLKILRGLNLVPVRFRPSAPLDLSMFDKSIFYLKILLVYNSIAVLKLECPSHT